MAAFCVIRLQDTRWVTARAIQSPLSTTHREKAGRWRPALNRAAEGDTSEGWWRGPLDSLLIKFAVRGSMQSGFNLQPIGVVFLRRAYLVEHE